MAAAAPDPQPGEEVKLGYFTNWGVYGRNYHVKNLVTSGSAEKITHINYAFGNVQGGKCTIGDAYADYDKAYTADQSVDGVADTWDQPLRGFNQLRKLKAQYPHIKVLFSFGGWTWSGGFPDAVKNPAAFAKSCHDLVEDPRWADVFDGIDLDWEYPNACGLSCDTTSAPNAFSTMMKAMRESSATTWSPRPSPPTPPTAARSEAADYGAAAQYIDWYNVMTYDFFGAWAKNGPTAPHSPLTSYDGIPQRASTPPRRSPEFKAAGVPAAKLLPRHRLLRRGWTGVTQSPRPAARRPARRPARTRRASRTTRSSRTAARPPAPSPAPRTRHCGSNWWSYDTPATVKSKMDWAEQQKLGGAFFWEFSGDTANGELVSAIDSGLK
ncbi:glycosyl hydrolase family 18 protein [Streptomyces thinghirensis]|nr:glycosyl hydrolase family 18 protein [Streptomyces thinghirensis]